MDVLATRTLSSTDDNGIAVEIVLTVFSPVPKDDLNWQCGYLFGPPFKPIVRYGQGHDFIDAFIYCLMHALVRQKTYDVGRRAHWQGMADWGFPEMVDRPASWTPPEIPPPDESAGSMDVLTTRRLHDQDESGAGTELLLTIFVPFKAEGEAWKCGLTFGPPGSEPFRCGVGEDFIEALLDALAMARVIYEKKVPEGWGWSESGGLQDCADLPYKIGRSFRYDLGRRKPPAAPDPSAP